MDWDNLKLLLVLAETGSLSRASGSTTRRWPAASTCSSRSWVRLVARLSRSYRLTTEG